MEDVKEEVSLLLGRAPNQIEFVASDTDLDVQGRSVTIGSHAFLLDVNRLHFRYVGELDCSDDVDTMEGVQYHADDDGE